MTPVCWWQIDDDGVWDTGCRHRFEFTADGPKENDFHHCPYCGRVLKVRARWLTRGARAIPARGV